MSVYIRCNNLLANELGMNNKMRPNNIFIQIFVVYLRKKNIISSYIYNTHNGCY